MLYILQPVDVCLEAPIIRKWKYKLTLPIKLNLYDNWKLISFHIARLLQVPCDKSRDKTSNSIRVIKDWFPDGIESLWEC